MANTQGPAGPTGDGSGHSGDGDARRRSFLRRLAPIIIVSSVTFTFISYWRTAAVVLCDLASTSYYIGGIVETAIGPAAPWFILAVMLLSGVVTLVYIESCSLFIRGGVYRVVREAIGRFFAKFAVSALLFDYILTGPISGVSAGQYIMGLALEGIASLTGRTVEPAELVRWKEGGSVIIAVLITLYFFRQNLVGIHESSDKAIKIMKATTVMGVVIIAWCGLTLIVNGPKNDVPMAPDLNSHVNFSPYPPKVENPLGFINHTALADRLREAKIERTGDGQVNVVTEHGELIPMELAPGAMIVLDKRSATLDQFDRRRNLIDYQTDASRRLTRIDATTRSDINWLSIIGVVGLLMAFGHSILAMSGAETLAQVYREVESPKLPNFKKAAFIVFVYSLALTGTISFLAVLLIPDAERMPQYSDNLIGGLAMNVIGPIGLRFALRIFVVVIGFLILAGAVNTAIIGSNGVLNRVAEDGVMHDWFLKPHPRYGTTSRLLWLIFLLQVIVILLSRGDVILLGEAYAFGVVWSFVFQALSMVVLRFKDRRPREYKVPLNIKVGGVDVPIGLGLILVVLLVTAIMNLLTKETATIWGGSFTLVLFALFTAMEAYHDRKRRGARHEHLEQFNREAAQEISAATLGLTGHYRKLVAIRSPHNLFMLEKALAETDPETTSVVVMTAKVVPQGGSANEGVDLDAYDQQLMTAVVQLAERAGKEVKPLIVPTNNPFHAVMQTAKAIQAHEAIVGASNKYTADEQMEQIAFYWISLHGGEPAPLTVRILSRDRDMYLDLGGGNRIPKISERKARSVAELRAAGIGVDRVLLIHDGSPAASDLFHAVLTMLDPQVILTLVPLVPVGSEPLNGHSTIQADKERAEQLGRALRMAEIGNDPAAAIVELARREQHDLIILALPADLPASPNPRLDERTIYILQHAHCRVFLAAAPIIPPEVVDTQPSGG